MPLRTLHRSEGGSGFVAAVAELVGERGIEAVVVGLPLSLSGGAGPAATAARGDILRLRRSLSVPVVAWDERMTTRIADRSLAARGLGGRKRRRVVDQLAASAILQSWLDAGMPLTGA